MTCACGAPAALTHANQPLCVGCYRAHPDTILRPTRRAAA